MFWTGNFSNERTRSMQYQEMFFSRFLEYMAKNSGVFSPLDRRKARRAPCMEPGQDPRGRWWREGESSGGDFEESRGGRQSLGVNLYVLCWSALGFLFVRMRGLTPFAPFASPAILKRLNY